VALSDCPKCWETPCICGHDYEIWPMGRLSTYLSMLEDVLMRKAGGGRDRFPFAEVAERIGTQPHIIRGMLARLVARFSPKELPAEIVEGMPDGLLDLVTERVRRVEDESTKTMEDGGKEVLMVHAATATIMRDGDWFEVCFFCSMMGCMIDGEEFRFEGFSTLHLRMLFRNTDGEWNLETHTLSDWLTGTEIDEARGYRSPAA